MDSHILRNSIPLQVSQIGGVMMSAQTLIVFDIFKLPKRTKTIKKISKYLKYPRDCVLCVLKAKCAKTKKNVQSLQYWQFQSPKFHKLSILVPKHIF
jgi:hypothetical protein